MMTKMLTPREVAEILQISYEKALAFLKYSDIDCHVIGRQYRVSEEVLNAYLLKKGKTYVDLTGTDL